MKLTTLDLLDSLTTAQWELVHAKLRSAQLALRITADEAFEDCDWITQTRITRTLDDLAELDGSI